jgi:hypothetical protein
LYELKVQKRRRQVTPAKAGVRSEAGKARTSDSAKGRTYRFGEFDILAVNMRAVTRQWRDFRYTLSARLRPHPGHKPLIHVIQSVPLRPNDVWTDDLSTCLAWFSKADTKKIRSK